jgi:hypothetical protein
MRYLILAAAMLLTNTAHADRDPAFESGLVAIPVQGSQVLPGPSYARPQLITKDTATRPTVGAIAAVAGSVALIGGWVFYVARANYRLQPRTELGGAVDTWQTLGHWSLTLGGFGAANLVVSEALLLPPAKGLPTLALIGGIAGIAGAAVGAGFILGGTHCSPLAYAPGSQFPTACMSGTSDAIFGWQILLTSTPLLSWPLVYLFRNLFAGPAESLTVGPGRVEWRGTF